MKHVVLLLSGVLGIVSAAAAVETPPEFPAHPRILFSAGDLPAIKQRIASQAWAKRSFERLQDQADGWLKKTVKLPDRGGQWYHYYSCPKHGARLRTEGPTRHVCPVDKEVLTGYPYDDVVISAEHDRLADAVRLLGIVYQLTGKEAYATKAREILLAYAAKYESYPLHNIRGEAKVGGGKVGPQTLDESTWLIDMVEGADCLWDFLAPAERDQVAKGLMYPATTVIRQHRMGIHNIQCWKNSAVGLAGLLLGDVKLVDEAINGPSGYVQQMAKGVSADGPWFENAWGYHFYTVSAVAHLTEGAFHSGINLYGPEFKRMLDGPLSLCMPDFRLPAFNDSHTVSLIGQAPYYEIGLARYQEDRYKPLLARSPRSSTAALFCGSADVGSPDAFAPKAGNFPATGNAVLAAGQGKDALWLCLDYGPHGGGHGHPDKLGFVAYGQGRIIAADAGTANYGVPIQSGWYRTSIAHNTLTVNETSQKAAEGNCEAFIAAADFCAVTATAGKIYEGVEFRRTIAMLGERLLVFVDQVKAGSDHVFDFAYHNPGKFASPLGPPGAQAFEPPRKPGYSYLRDTRQYDAGNGFELAFDIGEGKTTRWLLAGGRPVTVIAGTGVGGHTEDRVPLAITRVKGQEAVLRWAVVVNSPELVTLASEPVTDSNGQAVEETEAAAVRIKNDDGIHVLVVNATGKTLRVAGQSVADRLAWFQGGKDGKLYRRHGAR